MKSNTFTLIKIVTGSTQEEVNRKVNEFKKKHTVVKTRQYTDNLIYLYYLEDKP